MFGRGGVAGGGGMKGSDGRWILKTELWVNSPKTWWTYVKLRVNVELPFVLFPVFHTENQSFLNYGADVAMKRSDVYYSLQNIFRALVDI